MITQSYLLCDHTTKLIFFQINNVPGTFVILDCVKGLRYSLHAHASTAYVTKLFIQTFTYSIIISK